jgi:hypothetical protein
MSPIYVAVVRAASGSPGPAGNSEHGKAERALCKKTSTAGRRGTLEQLAVGVELFRGARLGRRHVGLEPAFTAVLAGGLHPSCEEGECLGSAERTHLGVVDFLAIQA